MSFDALVFVDRIKVQFLSSGKIFDFALNEKIVKDLEVVNKEEYVRQLNVFLNQYKITPQTAGIFLSENVCFISPVLKNGQVTDETLKTFEETMPFENPVARIYRNEIIGTNKELYEILIQVLAGRGVKVKTVAPIFLLKETIGLKALNSSVAKIIFNNENLFSNAALDYPMPIPSENTQVQRKEGKLKKRELILIAVFAALFVGLVFYLLTTTFRLH